MDDFPLRAYIPRGSLRGFISSGRVHTHSAWSLLIFLSVEVLPRARLQTNVRRSSEHVTRLEAPLLRDARKVRQDVMIAAGHISTCRICSKIRDISLTSARGWDAQKKCPGQKWCGTAAVCCCEAVCWDDLGTFYTQLWWHQPKKLK
jgi:hypothetical protein